MSEVQSPKSKVEEKTALEDKAEIRDLFVVDGELLEDSIDEKPETRNQKPEAGSRKLKSQ